MSGSVYFVQAVNGGAIKIGYTSGDPAARLRTLQTSSPERLRLLGSREASQSAERELHERLKRHRLSGEWFADVLAVRAAIKEFVGSPLELTKPRTRMLPCGCVIGIRFCADGDAAWREVGLAKARNDVQDFGASVRAYMDHVKPKLAESRVAA